MLAPTSTARPPVVTRAEWLAARVRHLKHEKALTTLHDQLLAERRQLPWTRVETDYHFTGPDGDLTLGDLFAGRSQLLLYHFMFGPDWDQGCKSCSLFADHVDGPRRHFEQHDVSFAAVARAPYPTLAAFHRRMGWGFTFVSSFGSPFNYDFHVSMTPEQLAGQEDATYNYRTGPIPFPVDEMPGLSVFVRDAATGEIFHTYSAFTRGLDILLGVHNLLDLTPKGRDEHESPMDWVRHHDRYAEAVAE